MSAENQSAYRERLALVMQRLWELDVRRQMAARGENLSWLLRYPPRDRLERFAVMLAELIEETEQKITRRQTDVPQESETGAGNGVAKP